MSNVHTPERAERIDNPDGMPEGVEATVSSNAKMAERLNQPANPGASTLQGQHPELFKANGNFVQKTSFRTGRNGNTFGETRGATTKAAAEDMLEVEQQDARDMAEAERIMGEVAEARAETEESADDGGIPQGNPERAEVEQLSTAYTGAEIEADAALTSIENQTATALNAAVSGVDETGPDQMVHAG